LDVTESPLRFWGSAVLVAVVFAALVPLLMPFERLRLVTPEDQQRAWLLTVFCGGVIALLFGASAVLTAGRPGVGVREVADAGGSVQKALEVARERRQEGGVRNFGTWTIATGGALIGCYFVLWLALG
jgi:hypothetical protein